MTRDDRRKLGAHFTPRAYVERLVEQTVIVPLREEWKGVQANIEGATDDRQHTTAVRKAHGFLKKLRSIRVLDPACGTGNFLYVAMEMIIRLQGEVFDMLVELGETDALDVSGVRPHQFLGIEVNPRAVRIASIVLSIGFLQQHYRNHCGHPAEPILPRFDGIEWRDALIEWDGAPDLQSEWRDGAFRSIWPNARPAKWPRADFIVGNPPFVGGAAMRSRLDAGYADALRHCYPQINESADLVMYWWDHAARELTTPGTSLQRFGFVTTNSITQAFQRRVIERWLDSPRPLSLIYAIPDHPWISDVRKRASVRIAMTVAAAGSHEGVRAVYAAGSSTYSAAPSLSEAHGHIHADLSIGVDVTRAKPLAANTDICSPGFKLHGAGFVVSRADFSRLGMGRRHGLAAHVRPYRTGRDLVGTCRDAWVLDFHGLGAEAVRERFPETYQHLLEQVKEVRDDAGHVTGRDANRREVYRDAWWLFGEPRASFRPALKGLRRYIATTETAKHRIFRFLNAEVAPDNTLVCIADQDAATLAILSSRIHGAWCTASGGLLEDRPRYTKSRCFDPFPFPELSDDQRMRLAEAGEALERHRRTVLRDNPDLTLTEVYNVLTAIRSGARLSDQDETIKQRGLVVVLQQLHEVIDRRTADAYGWSADDSDTCIVERLTALNGTRADEEADGRVQWLRPDYQAARPAARLERETLPLPFGAPDGGLNRSLRVFPTDNYEQPLALRAALREVGSPIAALDLA
ncbi:MAG: class I SAM-dependent DNA methyltransferase, partial [Sphingomonadales bacterium]